MTLQEIVDQLNLRPLTARHDFDQVTPSSGYASDLLSCVMAGARRGGLWVTLQAHANIVAVAALLDLSAVIITEGAMPDPETIAKANEEGVILLSTDKSTFHIVGRLWELGLKDH
ncbi:MAG: DRTGG domain-containing protein [Anaerolineae bacterium]|nr:DRTGG domain-containing protein [Anaerolineae bacterium]MDW8099891.1 DRTGG domain-containing protein [Anaerolineae bacterium]